MAEIIDLTSTREFRVRELERVVEDGLKHSNDEVLSLWKELATAAVRKYPGPPNPTHPQLNFTLPRSVSEAETDNIRKAVQELRPLHCPGIHTVRLSGCAYSQVCP